MSRAKANGAGWFASDSEVSEPENVYAIPINVSNINEACIISHKMVDVRLVAALGRDPIETTAQLRCMYIII